MAGPTATTPKLWLKADTGVYNDAGSTLCTNGDTVYQWNDQSGNGNHCTQTSSGDRPTYNTNKVNSLPAVTFNSKYLLQPYVGTTAFILIVVKGTTAGDNCVLSAQPNAGASSPYWLMTGESAGKARHQRGSDSDTVTHTLGKCTGKWFALSGSISGATVKTYINGTETNSSTLGGTPRTPTTTGYVGCGYFAGVVAYFVGELAEVLIYDTVPGSTELADIQTYIKNRYFPAIAVSNFALATFDGSFESLRIFTGSTSTTFAERLCSYVPSTSGASCRDPSIIKYSDNYWYCCHTTISFGTGTSFSVARSGDLAVWNEIKAVDCSAISGLQKVWAPEWFVDNDGSIHILFTANVGGSGFALYEVHPTTSDLSSTWSSPVALTGSFPSITLDPFVVRIGSTYYLHFANNSSFGIGRAHSSSLTGSYTIDDDGSSVSTIANAEGPSVISISGGYRLFYDKLSGGPDYGIAYRDSTDNFATYGTAANITVTDLDGSSFTSRHGTIFATPTVAPPPFLRRQWRRWQVRR